MSGEDNSPPSGSNDGKSSNESSREKAREFTKKITESFSNKLNNLPTKPIKTVKLNDTAVKTSRTLKGYFGREKSEAGIEMDTLGQNLEGDQERESRNIKISTMVNIVYSYYLI